jgi:hypothetical protein
MKTLIVRKTKSQMELAAMTHDGGRRSSFRDFFLISCAPKMQKKKHFFSSIHFAPPTKFIHASIRVSYAIFGW